MGAHGTQYFKATLRQQLLVEKATQWRDRALDAEAKINDLYNQLDEMAAQIERLKAQIEEREYVDRLTMTEEEMYQRLVRGEE